MNAWKLPTSLNVSGVDWKIRTDFRVIIDILGFFSDQDYEMDERMLICLDILYEDFENMQPFLYEEAMQKAVEFIDMGITNDKHPKPHTMDWEQDAPIIIPAVNKVIGGEIRSMPYMHWWTFLGSYMEIGKSLFANVISIRQKNAKHKKLEKWEQEFYRENKELIDLKKKYTEEENELLSVF